MVVFRLYIRKWCRAPADAGSLAAAAAAAARSAVLAVAATAHSFNNCSNNKSIKVLPSFNLFKR